MIATTNLIEVLIVQNFRFESQESTGGILNGIQVEGFSWFKIN